jgi:hypothetical protein
MEKEFDFRSIKTINDACEKTGTDFEAFMAMIEPLPEHIQALCALTLITKAINDGWQWKLDGIGRAYFPWICLYPDAMRDKIEDSKSQSQREDLIRYTRPDGSCGLAFADSPNAWSRSNANIGSRLACKSDEEATWIATQFKDLLASWLLPMEDCRIIEKYIK